MARAIGATTYDPRSDDDRALHDHPWVNMSILLEGTYTEHTIAQGGVHHATVYREWGFHCDVIGWRHWRLFVANGEKGQIGKGCDP